MKAVLARFAALLAASFMIAAGGCVPQEACRVVIYGQVFDAAAGSGLAGVGVSAPEGLRYAESGLDGAYELPPISMNPGALTITFVKEGFGNTLREVPVSRSARIRVDASMIQEDSGAELVRFEFTLMNDYEPGPAPTSAASAFQSLTPLAHLPMEAESVVVYPKRGSSFTEASKGIENLGAKVLESDMRLGCYIVDLPEGVDADSLAEAISSEGWAEGAEPDHVCFTAGGFVPDDPLWPLQWGPRAISMPRAWNIGTFEPPMIIALIDTGVDATHPDLSDRCLPMLNSINSDMLDNDGHGTHVAGIMAAASGNGIGIAGVVESALLLPVKALENNGFVATGTMSSISRGIRLAADHGADVINMSIGWPLFFSDYMFRLLKEALDYADSMGIALVAAAGNDGSATDLTMPGKYSKCFSVSALTSYLEPAAYANIGPGIDIFAPGGGGGASGIISTAPFAEYPSGYIRMSGTSMATPHVSALFASLMSTGLTADEAADALTSSSQLIEGQQVGMANAYAAMAGARGSKALFWLCDDDGDPLTYSFRGSDGSRDVSVWGGFEGVAFLCGWVKLSSEDYPAQGDFFGIREVSVSSASITLLTEVLELRYVDLEDGPGMGISSVPPERTF